MKWILSPYNKTRGNDNPTRLQIINSLISTVRRKETHGVGSQSQSDPKFTSEVIDGFRVKGGHVISRRHSAMPAFQIHLVGRGDGNAKAMKKNLKNAVCSRIY